MIQLRCRPVTVFRTLPEETLVVAQERRALRLRLVFQDRVPFETQLLRRDRHGHLHVVHFPFRPSATIHPDTAVLHPLLVLHLIDSGQDSVETNLMRPMRIGQVASHKHLIRLNLLEQRLHDVLIHLAQLILLDHTGLIERQVEKMHMVVLHARITASVAGLLPADRSLHEEHVLTLRSAILHLLITQVMDNLLRFLSYSRIVGRILIANITQILAITDHLLITHGDITGSLVSHMHVVMLVAQATQRTTHRDHVIIRMRAEDNHLFRIRQRPLRTAGIVGVRLATRPTGNRMLDIVEDLDIYIVCRTIQGQ